MLGTIIGGGISALGSIFGGAKASKAMRNVRDNINRQKAENDAWYNSEYYADATQRADAQRAINMTMEEARKRTRQARAMQAVTGGTDASVAAESAQNGEMIADTMASIAADGARRKDAIQQQYRETNAALDKQLNDMETGRAKAISEAAKGVASAGAKIAERLG